MKYMNIFIIMQQFFLIEKKKNLWKFLNYNKEEMTNKEFISVKMFGCGK